MINNITDSIILEDAYKSLFNVLIMLNVHTVSMDILGVDISKPKMGDRTELSIKKLMRFFNQYPNQLTIFLACPPKQQAMIMKLIKENLIFDDNVKKYEIGKDYYVPYVIPKRSQKEFDILRGNVS